MDPNFKSSESVKNTSCSGQKLKIGKKEKSPYDLLKTAIKNTKANFGLLVR